MAKDKCGYDHPIERLIKNPPPPKGSKRWAGRILALAALAAALTLTPAAPAWARNGTCLPNTGNTQTRTGPSIKDWAQAEWITRPSGCYIQVKALFKSTPTIGYTKYSGPVTALDLWTRATANADGDALAGAWYHYGPSSSGPWSSWLQFYP